MYKVWAINMYMDQNLLTLILKGSWNMQCNEIRCMLYVSMQCLQYALAMQCKWKAQGISKSVSFSIVKLDHCQTWPGSNLTLFKIDLGQNWPRPYLTIVHISITILSSHSESVYIEISYLFCTSVTKQYLCWTIVQVWNLTDCVAQSLCETFTL